MENIKKIRVFLSCPNDLVEDIDIVTVVDDILNEGNSYFEDLNGVRFELKHWQRDVYLGEGKPRVQDRINERLVSQCDIYIGILWTRYGTPSGIDTNGTIFGSGTEEEFDCAKRLRKELWFFFCDYEIRPSKIDLEQLRKIKGFKSRLEKAHVEYGVFSKEEEFRKKLKSNLKNWILKQNAIAPLEKPFQMSEEKGTKNVGPPGKEDFSKFNRGF